MSTAYSSSFYELIEKIENSHFWFRIRNRLIRKVILKFLPQPEGHSFLEIGFGTGIVIRMLEEMGFCVTGIDIKKKAVEYACSKTKARLIQKSIFSYQTKEQFDAIGAFDVAEHQKNDSALFKAVYCLLKPGGYFFVTVPAQKWLWSRIDELSKHKRRYSEAEVKEKLKKAGFEVVYINCWQMILLPAFYLMRLFTIQRSDALKEYLKPPSRIINTVIFYLLLIEQFFVLRMKLPVGTSIIVCATKRGLSSNT